MAFPAVDSVVHGLTYLRDSGGGPWLFRARSATKIRRRPRGIAKGEVSFRRRRSDFICPGVPRRVVSRNAIGCSRRRRTSPPFLYGA